MTKKRAMTSAELMEQLQNDPEYQEKMRERERKRLALEKELARDEAILVSQCKSVGIDISSVWDLVNTRASYKAAIPILLEHIDHSHHPRTREGIVRALTTSEARGMAAGRLIELFQEVTDSSSSLKWLIGSAIAETATASDASLIIDLIRDESHGNGRAFLPLALLHMEKSEALPILEQLANHPEMGEVASKALMFFS